MIAVRGHDTSSPATWKAYKVTEAVGMIVRTKINWLEDEWMLSSVIPDARNGNFAIIQLAYKTAKTTPISSRGNIPHYLH